MNCPLAVWMVKDAANRQTLECYCRTLYMTVWHTDTVGNITMCDAPAQAREAAEAIAREVPEFVPLSASETPETKSLRCAPLASGVPTLTARAGVDPACYLPGQLEHPAVAGLMLSLDERLYSNQLEFVCSDGTTRLESLDEKRFRIKWKAPIALTTAPVLSSSQPAQPDPAFNEETQSFGLLATGKKAKKTTPTEYL